MLISTTQHFFSSQNWRKTDYKDEFLNRLICLDIDASASSMNNEEYPSSSSTPTTTIATPGPPPSPPPPLPSLSNVHQKYPVFSGGYDESHSSLISGQDCDQEPEHQESTLGQVETPGTRLPFETTTHHQQQEKQEINESPRGRTWAVDNARSTSVNRVSPILNI